MKTSLMEKLRSRYQNPFEAVKNMGVAEGLRVADIGAGKGYFTIPAAMVVGDKGLVYSVEPDKARSETIRNRVTIEGLHNVKVLTTKAEDLGDIASGDVDLAFSVFSAHHFEDKDAVLGEIKRILREGGSFYIWDRIPGLIMKHGTRQSELERMASGFTKFESLSTKKTTRGRLTK